MLLNSHSKGGYAGSSTLLSLGAQVQHVLQEEQSHRPSVHTGPLTYPHQWKISLSCAGLVLKQVCVVPGCSYVALTKMAPLDLA